MKRRLTLKLHCQKNKCAYFFVSHWGCRLVGLFSDKNSTFFSGSVTVFSSLTWYDRMLSYLRAGGPSLTPTDGEPHRAEQAGTVQHVSNRGQHSEPDVCHQSNHTVLVSLLWFIKLWRAETELNTLQTWWVMQFIWNKSFILSPKSV